MKKTELFSKIALCVMTLSVMMSFSGCGGKDSDTKTVSVIVKSQQAPEYWNVVNKGAEEAGEELGYEIKCSAPESEKNIDEQISLINKAVADKSDAIVIAPINGNDMNEAIQKAVDSGITVVTIDSKCTLDDMIYIGTDNNTAGNTAGREAKNLLNGSKKVAVIALSESSEVSIERAGGFAEIFESDSEVNIVETKYCNADTETAKQQTIELLEKYPDLELIYGVNQNATLGICEAVSEKNLAGKVKIIGFDSCEDEINYVNDGVLNGFIVQNPYNMGYLGIRNVSKILNGELVSNIIDTGSTFVNADNINEKSIQLLLYPLK